MTTTRGSSFRLAPAEAEVAADALRDAAAWLDGDAGQHSSAAICEWLRKRAEMIEKVADGR